MATEIRNLQRTDIREAEEYFAPGQKGSSAMPHKRNPITCEKISGMARLLRGYAVAALEDVTLWHERDISHSSVERVILPDATIALDHMLRKFINIVDKLLVYPDAMIANMNKTGGLIYSQNLLIALVSKGVLREDAYKWYSATLWRAGWKVQTLKPMLNTMRILKNTSPMKKLSIALTPCRCCAM